MVIQFNCNSGTVSGTYYQDILEVNKYTPEFSLDVYEATVPLPLPKNFDLTPFLDGSKGIRAADYDLSGNTVEFKLASNDYLQVESLPVEGSAKQFKAVLKLKEQILKLPGDIELELEGTDQGDPPRTGRSRVVIKPDLTIEYNDPPAFKRTFFHEDYNPELGNSFVVELIPGTAHADVRYELVGDDAEYFALSVVEDKTAATVRLEKESRPAGKYFLSVVVQAKRSELQTAECVILVDLKEPNELGTTVEQVLSTLHLEERRTHEKVFPTKINIILDCQSPTYNFRTHSNLDTKLELGLQEGVEVGRYAVTNTKSATTANEYLEVTVDNDQLVFTVKKQFEEYEKREHGLKFAMVIQFNCNSGTISGTYYQDILEVNKYTPEFSLNVYEATVPLPLPKNFDLTPFLDGSKGIRAADYDLSGNTVEFKLASNDYLQVESLPVEGSSKQFKAVLKLKEQILKLPGDIELELEGTDQGDPPRTGRSRVVIKPDLTIEYNDPPAFKRTFFHEDYNPELGNSFVVELIPGTAHADVRYELVGDDAEYFALSVVEDKTAATVPNKSESIFSVDETTGWLVSSKFDREDPDLFADVEEPQFHVVLQLNCANDSPNVSKNYSLENIPYATDITHLRILVDDINDNAPVFQHPKNRDRVFAFPDPTIAERLMINSLMRVSATDLDAGLNAEIRFRLDSDECFDIHPKSGVIYPTGNCFEDRNPVILTIHATDRDGDADGNVSRMMIRVVQAMMYQIIVLQPLHVTWETLGEFVQMLEAKMLEN
ncbi:conserved hypothetical protein [Culex quinquefasciatus]|uniref:Cadherin domain-containing protein n=1 Tax=Culex quinquefasciatus TaxID=7176 RepID=B0WFM5_CULQU|nr:conserved hypothetical protein [Culex quinquefasciatus]|eukprot:XP_001847509.1 conserved hypothetical protein [Culex quinquefasciatus]